MIERILRLLAGAGLTAALYCAHAQVITTVAGTDFTFPPTPLAAMNAPTGIISGVAIDASGNGNTPVIVHSMRSATTGFTLEARHAGQSAANTAPPVRMTMVVASMTGSFGWSP
jgi:hypothetical protein